MCTSQRGNQEAEGLAQAPGCQQPPFVPVAQESEGVARRIGDWSLDSDWPGL